MGITGGKRTFLAIAAILYIAYVAVMLLTCTRGASLWVVLAFGLAQLTVVAVGVRKAADGAEGIFRLYLKTVLPVVCFLAQLLAGAIIAVAAPSAFVPAAVGGLALLVMSVTALLGAGRGVDYAVSIEGRVDEETSFMKDFLLRVQDLKGRKVYDPQAIGKLEEKVRYSDMRSTPETRDIEEAMASHLASLEAGEGDSTETIKQLSDAVDRHSRVLKAAKTS